MSIANPTNLNLSGGGLTELKQRLLFVLFGIVVYRIGAHVPVPGLDPARLADLFNQQSNTIIGLFNMFSGGALSRLTVFAIGIMPYISASIMMQLFSTVIPSLEQLKKEGEGGRRKINQYTRYGTMLLGIFQALGLSKMLASQGIAMEPGFIFYFTSTITLVTGTMFLMWLGEQMTEKGVGNGISMIIFAGIASGMPATLGKIFEQAREGQIQGLTLILLLALVLAITAFVVFMERGQRRIVVNYAQRTQGKKVFAAQKSHLPLKINTAGVIPPIFATGIILVPATIAQWFGGGDNFQWLSDIALTISPGKLTYFIVFASAIIFFAFFYTSIVANPKDMSDNLKKSGAFIPGIRPGEQTANYIDGVMTRLTLVGAIYIASVCILPEIMIYNWQIPFFGGTSILIVVVVIMDFMAQVQSHLMSHQYESLMKKANLQGGSRKRRGK